MSRLKPLIFLFALSPLVFTGLACTKNSDKIKPKPVTLRYWRVFDDSDSVSDLIAKYNQTRPYVTIEYRKLRPEEYEKALLEAWAEDRGPDILSLPNTWLPAYLSKIQPLPEQLKNIAVAVADGSKRQFQPKTFKTKTTRELKNEFIDTVSRDVVIDSQIYGLPLASDNLALFFNRDLFNRAGIPEPPRTWTEIQEAVRRLTILANNGEIAQSGLALGTANNVPRSADLIALLIMQNGGQVVDDQGQVPLTASDQADAAIEALTFYTDFANPTKSVYTWDEQQLDAITAFTQSRVAMLIGYSYNLAQIRQRNPQMNLGLAPLPQISTGPYLTNIANYWVEVVAKKASSAEQAWDFILFATAPENVTSYLAKTKHPTALRTLITTQREDLDLLPFVTQILSATSWYKGQNAPMAEMALKEAITTVLNGQTSPEEALALATQKIQASLYQ